MDRSLTQRALAVGFAAAALVLAGIVIGSRGLTHFDPELVSMVLDNIDEFVAIQASHPSTAQP